MSWGFRWGLHWGALWGSSQPTIPIRLWVEKKLRINTQSSKETPMWNETTPSRPTRTTELDPWEI